jgi:hypothetical protein
MNLNPSNKSASSPPFLNGGLFDGLFEDLYEGVVEAFQESDWMTKGQASEMLSEILSDIHAAQVRMKMKETSSLDDSKSRYRRPSPSGPKVIQASGYFYSDEPKMIG